MGEPDLTVTAVARRLGVAPATLRSWERRYGLGPRGRAFGSRRRYTPEDVALLTRMRRLTLDGVAPAEAARVARESPTTAATPATELEFRTPSRVPARMRGLGRAALALDCDTVRATLSEAAETDGVIATWEGLLAPVLRAVGDRWAATGEGVEVEHCLAEAAIAVLSTFSAPQPARPVLLACADGEGHSLPLHALSAALAERGVGARMLGAALPPAALAAAVKRTGPAALLLYAHQPTSPEGLALIPQQRPPTTVIAGGTGWPEGALPERVRYVQDLPDAVHLVLVATGLG